MSEPVPSVGFLAALADEEIGGEQDSKGTCRFGIGCAVFADEEAVEHSLVHVPPLLLRSVEVSGLAVGQEGEASAECVLDRFEGGLGGGHELLRCVAPTQSSGAYSSVCGSLRNRAISWPPR